MIVLVRTTLILAIHRVLLTIVRTTSSVIGYRAMGL